MNRKPPFVGILLAGFLLIVAALSLGARPLAGDDGQDRPLKMRTGLEFSLSGGLAAHSFSDTTIGPRTWSSVAFSAVTETASIILDTESQPGVSFALTDYLTPALGIRLQADALIEQTFKQGGSSHYYSQWVYSFTPSPQNNIINESWPLSGGFTTTVLSFDLVYRFAFFSKFEAGLSIGPSYFSGRFKADTTSGLWMIWQDVQMVLGGDWFPVAISLDKSLKGLGFNVGLEIDWPISPGFKIGAELTDFIGPSATVDWALSPGHYRQGAWDGDQYWDLTQPMIEALDYPSHMPGFKVSLSYFKLAFHLKFGL